MDIGQLQAYAYFFFTLLLVFLLYSYIFHLYISERRGTKDYEKYGKLALDDEISSEPLEKNSERVVEK
ncbi:MAG TPA: cytochrome c oxidase, cbb3-type, CcoQ subunit [Campylobacterales bacterium]|nr:cytochrome c oxidase, cbb3-type, CcoQ subunit [Campylobacterales bacterium]HIO70604.1 cytochrome c oxidase, cbb3-type, CcoQ subunit [Campylobacterales bacterium]